jgi:DNA-binding SARP family transcriptional activator/tetratricopeptide (TPR) repeat protein
VVAVAADTSTPQRSAADNVAVRVLGPVGIFVGDRPVDLGGSRTKALVARLAMEHNQVVPVDALLDSLWPDDTSGQSDATLRSLISRLRQRLRRSGVDPGLIVTRQNGYLLSVEPDAVDAVRFERLLANGRMSLTASDPTSSAAILRESLELWHGPALGEVREELFAQLEARRLEELRTNAIETRVEADLQLGQHADVVGELQTLARSHWTRERLWCQWILALYRNGGREDALRVFEELKDTLDRELGVEPGLEATQLHQKVLARDPDLDWTEPTGPQQMPSGRGYRLPLPPACARAPRGGFFGRTDERTQMFSAFESISRDESHRIVFIGGEPGIGKTSLAVEMARQAHEQGAIVLFGSADEEFCAPYQPWADALTHLVEHAPRHVLDQFSRHVAPLVQMVPKLADTLGKPAASPSIDPEAARYVWFGAVEGMLREAGHLAPVVLVLDDLQWADVPSLHLLRHVTSSENPSRLLTIGVFREFGVGAIHPLAKLLGDARRWPNTQRIELRGIDLLDLQSMMEQTAGRRLKAQGLVLRDALLAETDGNPLFLGELLQHMMDVGSVRVDGGDWLTSDDFRPDDLPVSVREVVGQRVARLGDPARRALMCASVIGRDFDFRLLTSISELGENDLLDILDTAIDAALVVNTGISKYRFVHAMVGHAIYDMLAPTRRARLHREVAEAIEQDTYQPADQKSIVLAHHWAETNDPDSPQKAIAYARAAGDQALRQLAPDEALRWYTRVLSLLEQNPVEDPLLRCQLLVGIGQAQRQAGNSAFRESLLDAARMAKQLGATDLLVAAVLANSRGFVSTVGAMDAERVELLEAACDEVQDTTSSDRALLISLLALELTFEGKYERRKQLADQALAISEAVGDPAGRCGVINNIRQAIEVPETLSERLTLTAEAFELAGRVGDPVLMCLCALNRTFTLYQASEVAAGDDVLNVGREIAETLGQTMLRWWVTLYDVDRACSAGDLDEAEQLANRALELGRLGGQPDVLLFYTSQIGALRMMQGRAGEIVELVRPLVTDGTTLSTYSMFLAMLYCDLDRLDEARALLESSVANRFASVPYDTFWLPSLCVAAYVAFEVGWVEAAEPLFAALSPYADQVPLVGSTRWCQVSYVLGLLASTLGRADDADTFLQEAMEGHARMGARWCLARTQQSWGEILAARTDTEARDKAAGLLSEALTTAEEHGYQHIALRAGRALRALQ